MPLVNESRVIESDWTFLAVMNRFHGKPGHVMVMVKGRLCPTLDLHKYVRVMI